MNDFESEITVHNLQLHDACELRIKVVRKNGEGFTETNIERHEVQRRAEQQRQIYIARPFYRSRPIANTICLSVEDLKMASKNHNCWQVYDCLFRRILIYGKADVLNQYSKNRKTCYKFLIDDGTSSIVGSMNVSKESKVSLSSQQGRLTFNRNRLKQKREFGLNIRGNFLPPESEQCQSIIKSIEVLHHLIQRDLQLQKKEFRLGPLPNKALILGFPYLNNAKEVQLHMTDISLNDKIELLWKQQLNRLYKKEYLKGCQ